MNAPKSWPGPCRGFTLLEVLLAMVIATGLMIVALFFYQQIARLRTESVREIQKLSTLRLLMDRITADLRSARSLGYFDSGFTGGEDHIQFVKAELPAIASWTDDVGAAAAPPQSDLKRVGYTLVVSIDETNQTGSLMRWEEPNWPSESTTADTNAVSVAEGEEEEDFAALPPAEETRIDWNAPAASESESESEEDDASQEEAGSTILTEQVQYLRFRYFDGAAWLTSWDGIGLPLGVEIRMSPQAGSREAEDAETAAGFASDASYPEPMFRRVVYVPGNRADFEAPEDLTWLGETGAGTGGDTNSIAPLTETAEEDLP